MSGRIHEGAFSLQGRAACRDGGHGPSGMIRGHPCAEVSGGEMPGSGLLVSPLHEEAVGQPGEHGVEPEGAIRAQPTLIVATGDIEAGMEPVFDAPSIPVEGEPAFGVEFPGGQAGQEGDGLGLAPFGLPPDPGGLGGQEKQRNKVSVPLSHRASNPFCCSGGSVPGGALRSQGRATGQEVCERAPGGTPSGEPPLQRRG